MEYRNQHRLSGWGRIWSGDRSKSVNVFYVLRTSEVYAGSSKNPVRVPDSLHVVEMDFRGEDKSKKIGEPEWLRQESTLEAENGKSYVVRHDRDGVWHIGMITPSGGK